MGGGWVGAQQGIILYGERQGRNGEAGVTAFSSSFVNERHELQGCARDICSRATVYKGLSVAVGDGYWILVDEMACLYIQQQG